MDSKLYEIINDCKYVCENSKHVKINYDNLNELISNLDETKIKYWLYSNPFNILDFDVKTIIYFLLVYHTIGNYCFWGDPKWEINTEVGKLDGSFAMVYLIINRIKNGNNFDMPKSEFTEFVSSNVEIPL